MAADGSFGAEAGGRRRVRGNRKVAAVGVAAGPGFQQMGTPMFTQPPHMMQQQMYFQQPPPQPYYAWPAPPQYYAAPGYPQAQPPNGQPVGAGGVHPFLQNMGSAAPSANWNTGGKNFICISCIIITKYIVFEIYYRLPTLTCVFFTTQQPHQQPHHHSLLALLHEAHLNF